MAPAARRPNSPPIVAAPPKKKALPDKSPGGVYPINNPPAPEERSCGGTREPGRTQAGTGNSMIPFRPFRRESEVNGLLMKFSAPSEVARSRLS